MKTAKFIEDLSPLARRGVLTQAESRRLDVYLKSSEEARELHEIGLEYDQMRTERPGDDALLRRMSQRVLERHARRPQARKRGRLARGLVWFALGTLIASMAGASVWKYRAWTRWTASLMPTLPARHTQPTSVGGGARKTAPPGTASLGSSAPSAVVAPEPARDAEAVSSRAPSAGGRHAQRAAGHASSEGLPGVASTGTSEAEDARTLFSHANAERKSGNVARALASYQRLRQVYPTSPEARLSSVLSARLELRSGDAAGALAHFNRYLAVEPNGALAEEALQGKAQALGSLGRAAEERQAWRLLLERFPKSVQAQTARERLTQEP